MSSRILTSHFSGLEEFLQQHAALLANRLTAPLPFCQ